MRKIWGYKVIQCVVFIFIVSSFGIVSSKLSVLQLILEHPNTVIDSAVAIDLIKDIKVIKIIGIIIWAILIGLYSNFIYSINKEKVRKTNK